MRFSKVAISIDAKLLGELDRLVGAKKFDSRSHAFQVAITEKLSRLNNTRLAEECLKLDRREEQDLADLGLEKDLEEWPEY